jgi:ubiquinone biosynthesis protein
MRLLRIVRILFVFIRYRLDRLLPDGAVLPLWLKAVHAMVRLLPEPETSAETSLRLSLEQLGPIFIKFGQILSTRKDIMSSELATELEKLQDQVPPFPGREARAVIEDSLGTPVDTCFMNFSDIPLASASVAQVHTASLPSGEEVAIKVIRPGIETAIRQDLGVMYLLASFVEKFWQEAKRLHVLDIVRDYENTILNELNLTMEAANTATLRENWAESGKLYVPEVYWDYCAENVMVMERIYGTRATDLDTLKARGTDLRKLAHLGVEIFFTQVFEHNFFHADMHPGNVFVDTSDPAEPTYIGLDCAIIGSLTEEDKNYLAENLLAFFHQDYAKVAELHVASGWVPADTDVKAFEAVIRSVCAPIFQKPISEISFGKVLVSLFRTARQFDMEVQPQLVLLQKTLLNIEGMGRQIYPELDLWETAAPYMERWMRDRVGLKRIVKHLQHSAPLWLHQLPQVPDLAFAALTELSAMGKRDAEHTRLLTDIKQELGRQSRRSRTARFGGVALLAALLTSLLPLSGYASPPQALIGTSILGSLGVYWMYIQS